MASVEEDLGEGMYALRWAGQRIAVSSRVGLKTGQSLILKSELSPEGKPTLVVQGPALPNPGDVVGRVVYGPGKKTGGHGAPSQPQNRQVDEQGGQGGRPPDRQAEAPPGGHVAAGVVKINASTAAAPQSAQSLIGLVLEPLPEFKASAEFLMTALEDEKARLEAARGSSRKDGETKPEDSRAEKDAARQRPEAVEKPRDLRVLVDRASTAEARTASPDASPPRTSNPPPTFRDDASAPPPVNAAGEGARPDVARETRPAPPVTIAQAPAGGASAERPPAPPPERPAAGVAPEAIPVAPSGREPPLGGEAATVPAPAPSPSPGREGGWNAATEGAPRQPGGVGPVPAAPSAGGAVAVLPPQAGPFVPDAAAPEARPLPETDSRPPEAPPPRPESRPSASAPSDTRPASPSAAADGSPLPGSAGQDAAPAGAAPESAVPPTQPQPARPAVPFLPDASVTEVRTPEPAIAETPPAASGPKTPRPASDATNAPPGASPPSEPVDPALRPPPSSAVSPEGSAPESRPVAPPSAPVPRPPPVQTPPVVAGDPETGARPEASQPAAPADSPSVGPTAPSHAVPSERPSTPVPELSPGTERPGAAPPSSSAPAAAPPLASHTVGPIVPEAPPAFPAGTPAPPAPDPVVPPPSAPAAPIPPPPATTNSASVPSADAGLPRTRPEARPEAAGDGEMKPEVFLKEALTQIVKAAELPLASPSADGESLGVGGKIPEAIVDKAAGLLVQAAGLTPDTVTMEAARALVQNNVQVDRETVQAMIALAAGSAPEERESLFRAAARFSAKDVPLAAPLVSGLADVMERRAGAHELMDKTRQALAFSSESPEIDPLLAGARELLDLLHVDLESADAAQALERYVSTFGREALGRALALVEKSAQAVLETHPVLPRIDQALTAILTELEASLAASPEALPASPSPGTAGAWTSAPPPASAEGAPPPATENASRPQPSPAPMSPIAAYMKSPRAVPIEELLKNLPPMPKLARLDQPAPQQFPPNQPAAVQPPPASAPAAAPPATVPEPPLPARPAGETPLQPQPAPLAGRAEASILDKLDSLFQIPGLNKPELELLKPSGFLERFLNSTPEGRDPERVKAEADALFRRLLSENPEQAAKAREEVKQKEPAVLREAAARLSRQEAEIVRSEPVLSRLSDAASSLRDLGRQLLAVKAENLAGQDRQPGVMLAEVPFKLNDDAGEGRMQMFYRRGKGKQEGWTSRVILDLNTTRMGPVLGDMRFFGQDMAVNMFVENQETAEYLERSAEDLIDGLWAKGFRVKTKFMVLPPPPPAPELSAERPRIAGEPETGESPAERPAGTRGGTTRIGRLDVKG